uniref:Immunoglobulin domain-containing protein n=1 Tax=Astatotilapia calliptera TaxID=8154 RepID=A0A3P8Q4S7_ASTCA
ISNFTLTGVAPCRAIKHLIVSTVSGWIAASGSVFQTSEVQAGENVTLQCHRIYTYDVMTFWFRLVNGTTANSIAVQPVSSIVKYNTEFQSGKFEMTKNTFDVFLKIKQVDLSDSALYFCGFLHMGRPSVFTATYLKVQGKIAEYPICATFFVVDVLLEDGLTNLSTVILGSLTVFLLLVIIGLVVSIRKLHTGIYVFEFKLKFNPSKLWFNCFKSDAMNYAALSFHTRTNMRRPAPQRELEPNVLYAATR